MHLKHSTLLTLLSLLLLTSPVSAGSIGVTGDAYSFAHTLGRELNDLIDCLTEHMQGSNDNTVLFDGLSELLDPYQNGTQPFVFEFEMTSRGAGTSELFFGSFANQDLFPEGFTDPDTGLPLDIACLEFGFDNPLTTTVPVRIASASIEASGDDGVILPETDITELFDDPWDGQFNVAMSGLVGQGVTGVVVLLQTAPSNQIFADGFESGDASSWTDQVP